MTIDIDGIPVRLREAHDLGFLGELGKLFCVFDEQDSGNISFGLDSGTEQLFVKYAGAKTIDYSGKTEDAVCRLQQAMPVYEALRHPHLVELREHFAVADGYVAVFAWFPGECLHAHWAFTPQEKYCHPASPSYRYKQLPIGCRLESLDSIFAFHAFVAAQGYVAIDFYDGSVLYDFAQHRTKICDIDVYAKRPYYNTMGRLWGSSRFMSPEEYELGAVIDEVTTVFTLGATALAFLGGETDHAFEKWDGNMALFEVAQKAVNPERRERYTSIAAFRAAWDAARVPYK